MMETILHALKWLQAASPLIIACLTAVLIVVTGFYAWTSWRVMRTIEGDFRFRTQPLPTLVAKYSGRTVNLERIVVLTLETTNAPLSLRRMDIVYFATGMPKAKNVTLYWGSGYHVPKDKPFQIQQTFVEHFPKIRHITMTYTDLAGIIGYESFFTEDGTVITRVLGPIARSGFRETLRKTVRWLEQKEQEMHERDARL